MNKGQLITMLTMYISLIPIFFFCGQSPRYTQIGILLIWLTLILGNILRYILGLKSEPMATLTPAKEDTEEKA